MNSWVAKGRGACASAKVKNEVLSDGRIVVRGGFVSATGQRQNGKVIVRLGNESRINTLCVAKAIRNTTHFPDSNSQLLELTGMEEDEVREALHSLYYNKVSQKDLRELMLRVKDI